MITRFTLGHPSQWFTLLKLFKVLQGINRDYVECVYYDKNHSTIDILDTMYFSSYSLLLLIIT